MFGSKFLTPKPIEIYDVVSSGKFISVLLFVRLASIFGGTNLILKPRRYDVLPVNLLRPIHT